MASKVTAVIIVPNSWRCTNHKLGHTLCAPALHCCGRQCQYPGVCIRQVPKSQAKQTLSSSATCMHAICIQWPAGATCTISKQDRHGFKNSALGDFTLLPGDNGRRPALTATTPNWALVSGFKGTLNPKLCPALTATISNCNPQPC